MSAAAISAGSLDSEDWNAWALPWKVPITEGGMPISRRGLGDGIDRLAERDARAAD